MKKEKISKAIRRVKQAYGIETTVDTDTNSLGCEPVSDPEAIRHQRFTDRIMTFVDYGGLATIAVSAIGYGIYGAATKVPEVVNQLGLVSSDIYRYIEPFVNS